jgi:glucan 1,3-beta-glucosidase
LVIGRDGTISLHDVFAGITVREHHLHLLGIFNLLTGRRLAAFLVLLLASTLAVSYWLWLAHPVAVVDANAGRISCVSYAPYRRTGESPFDPTAHVSAERIEEDLTALSRRFDCVRTYSVGQGLDQVPAIARKHHMKVLLGIWLSRTTLDNDKEIALGLATAAAQHDTIRAIIVGNEVLLRGELAPADLAADITRVRQATDLPVTYADVWEFWLRYPEIAPAVSFITIHILPYWEDHPVAIEKAVQHVAKIREQMQAAFPGRELLIGETGWPSQGRQRQGARPSLVNEARFMRAFLNWANQNKVNYNVIEAFDQPWKRLLEGTAGGYWGVYDGDLHEKFAQTGPVVEEEHAVLGVLAAALGALVLLLLDVLFRRRRLIGASTALVTGAGIGAVSAAQWRELVHGERDLAEWSVGLALSVAALLSALLLARFLIDWMADQKPIPVASAIGRWSWRNKSWDASTLLGLMRFFWLFGAALMNLLLCFDGRYRDFPIFLYAAPVLGLGLTALAQRAVSQQLGAEEKLLAVWVCLSALVVVVLEGFTNGPALVWGLLCVLLGLPCLLQWQRAGTDGNLSAQQNQGA